MSKTVYLFFEDIDGHHEQLKGVYTSELVSTIVCEVANRRNKAQRKFYEKHHEDFSVQYDLAKRTSYSVDSMKVENKIHGTPLKSILTVSDLKKQYYSIQPE